MIEVEVKTQGRAPAGQISQRRSPWAFRHVIVNFAQRDLKARYKNTLLGWLWSVLVPLSMIATYTFVFSVILQSDPPPMGNGDAGIYGIFLLAGIVPWGLFSGGSQRGMGSLNSAGAMMKKIYLPAFVPVLGTIGALFVQFVIELGILLIILVAVGNISLAWLMVPIWVALLTVFTASLSLILAVTNVYITDLTLAVGVVFQMLFFLSAVVYPIQRVPEFIYGIPVRAILEASPITQFVHTLREIVYANTVPAAELGYLTLWTVALAVMAYGAFHRWGRDVGELL